MTEEKGMIFAKSCIFVFEKINGPRDMIENIKEYLFKEYKKDSRVHKINCV